MYTYFGIINFAPTSNSISVSFYTTAHFLKHKIVHVLVDNCIYGIYTPLNHVNNKLLFKIMLDCFFFLLQQQNQQDPTSFF